VTVKLVLEEYDYSIGAFANKRSVRVVYGEIERVVVKESFEPFSLGYYRVVELIPRSVPVILLVETIDNTTAPVIRETEL
jgi:hypothetical protein